MKKILRHFIIDTYCLYLISNSISGIYFNSGFTTLLAAGAAITIVSLVAKPVINILLLPINLLTFGLFRFLGSSVVLYLTTLLVKSFEIRCFDFPGLSSIWFDIPKIYLTGLGAYVAFSFILSFLSSLIYWLIK